MKIYTRIIFTLILVSGSALAIASSDTPAVNAINIPDVELVSLNPYVRLYGIKLNTLNKRLQVMGKVQKSRHNSHILPGHIHYVVLDNRQKIIQAGEVAYRPGLFLRSPRSGSEFSFTLDENIPQRAIIKLAWHYNGRNNHLRAE